MKKISGGDTISDRIISYRNSLGFVDERTI
jgi:hypothetical protein